MDTTVRIDDNKACISLAGKMTVGPSSNLAKALQALPREVCDIDIDIAGVDYVSSAGLRALASAASLATGRGGKLRLLHPQPSVRTVFDMTGVTNTLAVE